MSLIGHQYSVKRGRAWIRIIALLGTLMIVSMLLFLAGLVPSGVFLGVFFVFAVTAVVSILDFVLPILQDDPRTKEDQSESC